MPRCGECSKVVLRAWRLPPDCRTWSSGPELIRSAESGCDLCSFIRKEIEKVSAANLRRINNKLPIVLRDHNKEIVLSNNEVYSYGPESYFCYRLHIGSRPRYHYDPALEHPVLRARELLEACMLGDKHEHGLCKPSEVDSSVKLPCLPRRLLDISHGNVVLTLDTQEWIARNRATADDLSKYCTLSYRWGKQAPACMLSTQLTADRVLILVSMPQTFQDAIIVARGLGIRFLWIDALCIIQPSAHGDYTDWNMEGPRMWLVYQNVICNISATCSEQPSDGFLHKVGIDYNPHCSVPARATNDGPGEPLVISTNIPPFHASVVVSNLNRRGWVAQERLLSRRILHFTEEGVFRECQESKEYEIDDNEVDDRNVSQHHVSLMMLGDWLAFIEFYSQSQFTLQTDRLIALSSIARSVKVERFGHQYYAGIWGSHLCRCLSWSSTTPCSATARKWCLDIAPSWSWASVTGGIQYPLRQWGAHSESLLEILGVQTSVAEASNQYGNIKKGALKLRALLCNIPLPTGTDIDIPYNEPGFTDVLESSGRINWDEDQEPSTTMKVYTVIPLGIYGCSETAMYDALVITLLPSPDDEDMSGSCGVYRRIGHIEWYVQKKRGFNDENSACLGSEFHVWLDVLFPHATEQTIVIT